MTRGYLIFALAVIFAANFFNYLDRQLVSALEVELKQAFKLDKKGFGLLWTAFTVGYLVCAPLVGYLTDHYRRTRIFAVCVAVWSAATIGSGLAPSTAVLFVMRVLIGVGEAGCLIIGPTLISDYFDPKVRGRMLSVFFLGMPLGGVAGYLVGGLLATWLGWRSAFYFAGVPGFIIAALIWLLVDPPRGGTEDAAHGHAAPRGAKIKDYVALLRSPSLVMIILAQAFAVMILVPLLHFGVGFFEEVRAMGKQEAVVSMGIMALIAGGLGNSVSGIVGDRLAKRTRGAYALVAGICFWSGLPFLIMGFLLPSRALFLPALTLGAFFYFMCMPAVNTHIANVTQANQRAMAYALAVFVLHLLGDTAAPYAFGWVSEIFHSRGISQEYAFVCFSSALILAGACCLLAYRFSNRAAPRAASEPSVSQSI